MFVCYNEHDQFQAFHESVCNPYCSVIHRMMPIRHLFFTAVINKLSILAGKGKVFPLQARLWPREWVELKLYSSMTTALEGGEWSAARPGRTLPLGKTRYPLYRGLGGPQGQSGWVENLAPTGIWSPDHPACSQLLYRLNYLDHTILAGDHLIIRGVYMQVARRSLHHIWVFILLTS